MEGNHTQWALESQAGEEELGLAGGLQRRGGQRRLLTPPASVGEDLDLRRAMDRESLR